MTDATDAFTASLIDSLLSTCRLLAMRDLSSPAVAQALIDLRADPGRHQGRQAAGCGRPGRRPRGCLSPVAPNPDRPACRLLLRPAVRVLRAPDRGARPNARCQRRNLPGRAHQVTQGRNAGVQVCLPKAGDLTWPSIRSTPALSTSSATRRPAICAKCRRSGRRPRIEDRAGKPPPPQFPLPLLRFREDVTDVQR